MVYANDGAMLILKSGEAQQERWSLKTEKNFIGRADNNDIVLPVREVSRVHASIRLEQGQWLVEDKDSRNGTFLNGMPVQRESRVLQDGDELRIAEQFIFLFVDIDATAPVHWKKETKALLELDSQSRRVWILGQEIKPELSPLQFSLLELFYLNKNELVSRDQVARLLWPDTEGIISEQAIDSLVWRLRNRIAKLDPGREYITTVRGHGFRLQFVV